MIKIYAPKSRTPEHMNQKLTELKGKIIVVDFHTLLSIMDRTRQEINMEIEDNTIKQLDLKISIEHSAQQQQNTHSAHVYETFST